MSTAIPDSHLDLITGPVPAVLTTLSPAGQPENSIIWCSWDGSHILVASTAARRKTRNVAANPSVAVLALDPTNPYRWIDVRGTVDFMGPDPDCALINAHAKLYEGADEYYGGVAPLEEKALHERIMFKVRPERIVIFPAPA